MTTTPPANLTRFTAADDSWYRNKVYVGKQGSNTAYCVMSNQASCRDALHPDKGAQGSIWVVNGVRVTAGPGTPITQVNYVSQYYGLVYVDQTGAIATLDPNGNSALYPCADSCWASVGAASKSMLG